MSSSHLSNSSVFPTFALLVTISVTGPSSVSLSSVVLVLSLPCGGGPTIPILDRITGFTNSLDLQLNVDLAHPAGSVIFYGLLDFVAFIHYKRPIPCYWFI